MAKKREANDQPELAQVSGPETKKPVIVSPFLVSILKNNEDKFGEKNFMASDSEKFAMGIPFRHISQMFLFQANILPLSKVIGIAGKPASCKSSLGFHFIRMICDWAGYGHLLDTEAGKYSPLLIRSLVSDQHIDQGRMSMSVCKSTNNAQSVLLRYTEGIMEQDPAKSIPFGFVLDSLSGTTMEEVGDKINKDGFASKGFALDALSWTRFFKCYPHALLGWPIAFIFINHLKEKPPPAGMGHLPPQQTTPGGDGQNFHSAVYIYVTLIKGDRKASRDVVGETLECPMEFRRLKLFTHKNSLATGKKVLFVNMCWYFDENGKQQTYFDWESSTAELVESMQTDPNILSAPERKELRSICHLDVTKGRYTSKTLDLEDANGVTIGDAIANNEEIMARLKRFFHISEYPVLPRPLLDHNGIPIPRPFDKASAAKALKEAKARLAEAANEIEAENRKHSYKPALPAAAPKEPPLEDLTTV